MTLKILRFLTLMLAALTLGMTFCHLLQMPPEMRWDADLWMATTVRGGLYYLFGSIGAAIDVGAVITTVLLAAAVWRRGGAVRLLTVVAAVLYVSALAVWWLRVSPANQEFATWLSGPLPADWGRWRAQWEHGHAIGAVLHLFGFGALCWSVVTDTGKAAATGKDSRETDEGRS